jgi:small subunit ribosomal protein S20
MANVDSAKKRVRQTEKRTLRNKHVRTTVRSVLKKVREAMAKGDKKAATAALSDAIKRVDQAVSKGVYHKNAGSRYVARLSAQVAALAA